VGGFLALAAGTAVFTALGFWSAAVAEAHYGEHDCQRIVVDEIVGQLIALLPVAVTWPHLLLAFGFFRLFDSLKPWPAGWIDEHVHGGAGVILDDVAAGVQAAAVMSLLVHTGLVELGLRAVHLR
jgi:phosphatidylglycerophosphatase A